MIRSLKVFMSIRLARLAFAGSFLFTNFQEPCRFDSRDLAFVGSYLVFVLFCLSIVL